MRGRDDCALSYKALEFLNSDEAHALFGRALGFLQLQGTASSSSLEEREQRISEAQKILRRAGQRYANKALLTKCKNVWVWKDATCHAGLAFL